MMYECKACQVRWRTNTTECWCCGQASGEKIGVPVTATPTFSGSGFAAALAMLHARRYNASGTRG